jgi:acyl-[acyl-carrier-protein] desaturase
LGLYRWYVDRSQKTRNWNPDMDFDWRSFRTDHSRKMNLVLEGFFAVEQYVPDYVTTLLRVIRRSHGRSHFHIRWGSEEEKHADLWENTLLFSRHRSRRNGSKNINMYCAKRRGSCPGITRCT